MRKQLTFGILATAALVGAWFLGRNTTQAGAKSGPMVAHMVYFSLKDASPDAKDKLVASCRKHLTGHPGEVFFAAGTLCEDLKREVNDLDFDVGLHIVFKDKAAHDQYQTAPRHDEFIKEGKANWKKVRVFDSYCSK